MSPELHYYLWASLLMLAAVVAWCANLLSLPGNWFNLGLAALFAWLSPDAESASPSWWSVAIILALCIAGEVIEFAAGAAGAAKHGGSRRAMVLAVIGTVIGSILGAIIGIPIPIPVVASLIAAVGGGALGAFLGAYLGETWKGRSSDRVLAVSQGALVGRLLGTLGKLAIGAMIVVVLGVDAFF